MWGLPRNPDEHRVAVQEFKQRLETFNANHLKVFKAKQVEMLMGDKLSQSEIELAASLTRGQLRIVSQWLLNERQMGRDAGYGDETLHTLLSLAQRLEGLAK